MALNGAASEVHSHERMWKHFAGEPENMPFASLGSPLGLPLGCLTTREPPLENGCSSAPVGACISVTQSHVELIATSHNFNGHVSTRTS